jgi:hypothetical protein
MSMAEWLRTTFEGLGEQFVAYLPSLLAGLALIAVGLLLAFVAKRVAIRLFAILRLDRLMRAFRWGQMLSRGDIRHAFFELAGNLVFAAVILAFLYTALETMGLSFLSGWVQKGAGLIPRFLIALTVVGVGWWIAGASSAAVRSALIKEQIPKASLVARYFRLVLVLVAGAIALLELDIAKEVVLLGFGVVIVTLAVLAVATAVAWNRQAPPKDEHGPDAPRA